MRYIRFLPKKKWAIAGFTFLLYSASFPAFGSEATMLTIESPLKGDLNHSNRENADIKPQHKSLDFSVPCDTGDYLTGYVESDRSYRCHRKSIAPFD